MSPTSPTKVQTKPGVATAKDATGPPPPPRLLDQLRHVLRVRHYAYKTERSYVTWVRDYVLFHDKRHPRDMGASDIEAYLTHLAVDRRVAASTQNQALCAVLFLYRHVLKVDLGDFSSFEFSKRPKRLPVVLTVEEVEQIIHQLQGTKRLMVELLYGTGMRLNEVLRLRVKDVDFHRRLITVRDAKGQKDRSAILPDSLHDGLRVHISRARDLHNRDLADGYGAVSLPYALEKKYPNALREFGWQFVFPSGRLSKDPISGRTQRHHVYENFLQKTVRRAKQQAGIVKPVRAHTFRHSFATHLLESGTDIRTIQQLLGHKSVETTMIYTHVASTGPCGVTSPVDKLRRKQATPTPGPMTRQPSTPPVLPSSQSDGMSPSSLSKPANARHGEKTTSLSRWLGRAASVLVALFAAGDWRS